jgi:ribonuclease P protein component, eubacterial
MVLENACRQQMAERYWLQEEEKAELNYQHRGHFCPFLLWGCGHMKHTCAMRANRHFKRVYSKGDSIAGGYLVLYYQKNNTDQNVLGITVSKKIGKAVIRNRVRRLIKESYRLEETHIKTGYDLIFVSRTKAVGVSFKTIQRDMLYLLKKAGFSVDLPQ